MDRTTAYVTASISLHDVLNALELLAMDYPMDRMDHVQIERIDRAAKTLKYRLESYQAKVAEEYLSHK